ncbi:MAG TPA: DNA polymerase III subunit delta' [Syntrophales bacterium]|nr:DNA polymerase III subunit delta' [Syntrophales bacterium]
MSFRDIFGHEKQIAHLQSSMVQNRAPHAFLFYGMEGIGKKTTAIAFAKALNCRANDRDACDACDACRKADHKNHLDIITLEAEGQYIKIQAIRDLQERMKFKPWEGKRRVCIIDEADRMNEAAANALLKTLEEPPSANILILVTARPSHLPATILSRCRQVGFNPPVEETVASFLQTRLSIDTQAARLLAASSGGSIARALEMQSGSYLSARNELMDILTAGQMQDPLKRLSRLASLGQDRDEALERLSILRICYRDAMIYKETGETVSLINQDRIDIIKSLAGRLSTKDILSNIKSIDRAVGAVEQYADKTLTLEVMMFRVNW